MPGTRAKISAAAHSSHDRPVLREDKDEVVWSWEHLQILLKGKQG